MDIDRIFQELSRFQQVLNSASLGISFELKHVQAHQGLFKNWFRKEIPGENALGESGIYMIGNAEGEILYIGKATAGNLGGEIGSKFGAASKIFPDGSPYFGNSSIAKWADDKYKEILLNGEIQIRSAIIIPAELSSLVEVYLQTWCDQNGGLPPLNKRIG
jgi:hypothetical protein